MEALKRYFPIPQFALIGLGFFALYTTRMIILANNPQTSIEEVQIAGNILFFSFMWFVFAIGFLLWDLTIKLPTYGRITSIVVASILFMGICYVGYINNFDMSLWASKFFLP